MTDNPKLFSALLNGVFKNTFQQENDITPQYLLEEVFSGSGASLSDITELFDNTGKIMRQAAFENWEPSRLELLLKKTSLSMTQQEVFFKFWKAQTPKVRELIRTKSNWNNSLLDFQWRIDVKSRTKNVPEINEPTAIVELKIGNTTANNNNTNNNNNSSTNTSTSTSTTNIVRFEMNREQLNNTVSQFNSILEQLQLLT